MVEVRLPYPWGKVRLPYFGKLAEIESCCSSLEHFGHPFCFNRVEISEKARESGVKVVVGSTLTDTGWKELIYVPYWLPSEDLAEAEALIQHGRWPDIRLAPETLSELVDELGELGFKPACGNDVAKCRLRGSQ